MRPKAPFARKRFGQNFLIDQNVIQQIIAVIQPKPNDFFIEIGPGRAALTTPLLEILDNLHVIEIDYDLVDYLEKKFLQKKPIIHQADALKFDFGQFPSQKVRIVGNLPYNISTPLIFHLLDYAASIQDMHFMLQKEVVDRMVAAPKSKIYGRLSVMVQYFAKPELLFEVKPTSFKPIPKVQSAIIRLTPYTTLPFPADDYKVFKKITALAFQKRRKTLANIFKEFLNSIDFMNLNIDPQWRPEDLSLEMYVKISNLISNQRC